MISIRADNREETIPLEEFETRVRAGKILPSTPVMFPLLTGERWVDAAELELFRRLYAPTRIYFSQAFSLGRFPKLTALLCVLQIGLYFAIAQGQRFLALDPLIDAGAKVQANILELGETWRLLTANVLHRDWVHLFFNMFFLFNLGGTVENTYRTRDYVLVLLAAALSGNVLSTAFSATSSVGASGMVLGLFGAASVFGYKYAEILPTRYRRYFGSAVLPYALFIIYVGLTSRDTDNWNHIGGLLGGALVAIPLEPQLLHLGRPARPWYRELAPVLASLFLVAATLSAGPLIRGAGPRLERFSDPQTGFGFDYPAFWQELGTNHLGYPGLGNKSLGASVGARAAWNPGPIGINEWKRRFLEEDLRAREIDGEVTRVQVLDQRPIDLPGATGIELVMSLESRAGPQLTRNLLLVRGYYGYVLVLSAPKNRAEAYRPIFEAVAQSIRLDEPESLREARRAVAVFPGMSSAHVELGRQLAAFGAANEAAQAFQRALLPLPEHPEALYGLAKLVHDYGGDLTSAERTTADLYARFPS